MSAIADREMFPPGEYIRDELEAHNWTQEDLAAILGRPLKSVNQIITGKKAITTRTAQCSGLRLAPAPNCGSIWRVRTGLLWTPRTRNRSSGAKLFELVPVNEMIRRQWIAPSESVSELESSVLEFLGIASLGETPEISIAARWSTTYAEASVSQRAYAIRVRHLARAIHTKRFDQARARGLLGKLHALTVSPEEVRHVPAVLAEMGIKFVLMEHLMGTAH